ncbi:MAG TPA: CapA family protein [Candidatus Cloacimonadota bacterium]|nr:CapA family protein [Candidatus Cloacimonadota bacterium]
MKDIVLIFFLFWLLLFFVSLSAERSIVLESFETGNIPFSSWENEDYEPDNYSFCHDNTSSPYSYFSLKIYGNTWKSEAIEPFELTENTVWQIDVFCENEADIQGIGLSDGENTLFYSFFGDEMLDIEEWVPVYQGNCDLNVWNSFQLPVADDWFAWYEELPIISEIIFLNDADQNGGIVYFDDLVDITDDLPVAPQAEISYSLLADYTKKDGSRNITAQFLAEIIDPDSDTFVYYWDFGDGGSSLEESPIHNYVVEDDHEYTVLLRVKDESEKWGFARCSVPIDQGISSFPLTLNFVGDIMLARNMSSVIANYGLEAIIAPIYPYFGGAADISSANLECVFTNATAHHPTKEIYFKADPDNLVGISHAEIDLVSLANNHVGDYLDAGLTETIDLLDEMNILHGGAGMNAYEAYQPVFINKSGVNLAFLFNCDRTGQYNNSQPYLQAGLNKSGFAYMTPYYVSEQIADVSDVADLIVVQPHSGSEYSTAPGANYDFTQLYPGWAERDFEEDEDFTPRSDIPHMWDSEIRHHFIDQGADIVVCHHPHIIQGLEIYNGKLIAHSLGNFIFDLSYSETFPSMILNTKIAEDGFYEYSITPVFIDNFIPKRAEGELGLHTLEYLAMKSRELNTYLNIDYQNVTATVIIDTLAMDSFTNTFQEQLDLNQNDIYYVSAPLPIPDVGYLSELNWISPGGNYQVRYGREMVWNGNFEDEGSSEWNLNSNYEWYDEENFYSGSRSLCLQRNHTSSSHIITDLENNLRRFEDEGFTLHGYIKTENSGEATIEARFFALRTGESIDTQNVGTTVTGTTDWQFFYHDLSVPEEANFWNVNARLNPGESGVGFAWFDNIGMIGWTEWTDYNGGELSVRNPNNYDYLQVRSSDNVQAADLEYVVTAYSNPLVNNDNSLPGKPPIASFKRNYPNPFNPITTISFEVYDETRDEIEIAIYNIKGQKVKRLLRDSFASGTHVVVWDGTDKSHRSVASGIYFISLKSDKKIIDTRKCLLLK